MILDVSKKPKNRKLFLGEFGNLLRVDIADFPIIKQLKDLAEGNTWFAKEVDYTSDKVKFESLPEDAKRAFKLNIAYQTLMDSGVTGGIGEILLKLITNSEAVLLYKKIEYEESIHAESYSYGLSTVFGSEAEKIVDLVYTDKFVQKRMEKENQLFTNLEDLLYLLNTDQINKNEYEEKIKIGILELLVGLYLLESVKFPFSFLVTFMINDQYGNAIPGFTKTVKLIAHDEMQLHVPTGKNIISILKNDSNQEFKYLFDNSTYENIVKKMAYNVVEQEVEWANYLLEGKEVKGLNLSICEHFIKYQAQKRVKDIFVDLGYKEEKSDIISWFDNYRDINKQNAALQETTNISYQKGGLVDDLDRIDSDRD